MKMRHGFVLGLDADIDDLRTAIGYIPDSATKFKMEPVTEWQGYGPNEHEEVTAIEFSWETP